MDRIHRVSPDPVAVSATALAVIVCVASLMNDPYTYGHIGGEYMQFGSDLRPVPVYAWQRWYSAALVLLLGVGIGQICAGSMLALLTFILEGSMYLGVNIWYAFRDGLDARMLVGDQGSPVPGNVTLLGIVTRVALLIAVFMMRRRYLPTGQRHKLERV